MAFWASEIENMADSYDSLQRLTWLLDRDNQLLKRKDFRGYANLWEWTLHQDWAKFVVLYLFSERRELLPINTINTTTGDSIMTSIRSQGLKPEILRILLKSGERLDCINKKTGDTFLHTMAKFHRNTNNLLKIFNEKMQELILEGNINFPDPDYKNKEDITALQITLETGNISLAKDLVELLGANWKALPPGHFSSNKTVLDLLKNWDELYGLRSNNFLSEVEDDGCILCCEARNVPEELYLMECCGASIHVDCFRTYLARTTKPQCIFCNMLVVEELRYRVPFTIYKKRWRLHITKAAVATAAAARARTLQKKFASMKKEKEETAKKEKESTNVSQEVTDQPSEENRAGPSSRPARTSRPLPTASRRRRRSFSEDNDQPNPRRRRLECDDDDDFVPETTTFRLPATPRRSVARGDHQSGRRRRRLEFDDDGDFVPETTTFRLPATPRTRATSLLSPRVAENVLRSVLEENVIPFDML